jgi:hypothetical protein
MSVNPSILPTRVVPKHANKAQLLGLGNDAHIKPYSLFHKIRCWRLQDASCINSRFRDYFVGKFNGTSIRVEMAHEQ